VDQVAVALTVKAYQFSVPVIVTRLRGQHGESTRGSPDRHTDHLSSVPDTLIERCGAS
jgi:hypothetical protein